ncbi:MAG: hypothetical protein AAGF99_00430 [Bacteroidota bacterium]
MYYSTQPGGPAIGVSLDNIRRTYNFGNSIAYLAAPESVFLSTLMMGSKTVTDDPVFKHAEKRDQWHRQNFEVHANRGGTAIAANMQITGLQLTCHYDKFGRTLTDSNGDGIDTAPIFLVPDDVINVVGVINGAKQMVQARIVSVDSVQAAYVSVTVRIVAAGFTTDYATTFAGEELSFVDGDKGRSMGSVFAEGTGAPDGWTDEIYNREGYTQIFKTSVPVVTGTTLATRYRFAPGGNEWARIWSPKMKEHKLGITRAMLFNTGGLAPEGSATKRYTNGFIPYVWTYGVKHNFSYANTSYDDFMGFHEWFLDPERGGQNRKLIVCSRKIFTWANKLGDNGFLKNTLGGAAYNITVQNYRGVFGHQITHVWTPYGEVGFVIENQLRGEWEDYALVVDTGNVHYRPLSANGQNRETQVKTNVQGNDVDGRKDMILTEAGLQIDLPETHAIWKFS